MTTSSQESPDGKPAYRRTIPDSGPPVFPAGLRAEFSIPLLLVAAAAGVLSTLGMFEVFRDPYDSGPLGTFGLLAPAFTGFFMSIELLWNRYRFTLSRWLGRQVVLGLIFAVVNAVIHLISGWNAAEVSAREFYDYRDPTGADVMKNAILGFDLLGIATSLGGGVLGLLTVLLPVISVRTPKRFAEINELETAGLDSDPAARSATARVGIAMSILLLLVFIIPSFIVFGSAYGRSDSFAEAWGAWPRVFGDADYVGDLFWVLGVLLIPVGLAVVIFVMVAQRPDREKRRGGGSLSR